MSDDEFQMVISEQEYTKLMLYKKLYQEQFESVLQKCKQREQRAQQRANHLFTIIKEFIAQFLNIFSKQYLLKHSNVQLNPQFNEFSQLIANKFQKQHLWAIEQFNLIKQILKEKSELQNKQQSLFASQMERQIIPLKLEINRIRQQKQKLTQNYRSMSCDLLEALQISDKLNTENSKLKKQVQDLRAQQVRKVSKNYNSMSSLLTEIQNVQNLIQFQIESKDQSFIKFQQLNFNKAENIKKEIDTFYDQLLYSLNNVRNITQNQVNTLMHVYLDEIISHIIVIKITKTKKRN